MDDTDAPSLELRHVRLAAATAETVESNDLGVGIGIREPAADRRPDKPAAAGDEKLHDAAAARRPWASTIWSNVSPSEISGCQPG